MKSIAIQKRILCGLLSVATITGAIGVVSMPSVQNVISPTVSAASTRTVNYGDYRGGTSTTYFNSVYCKNANKAIANNKYASNMVKVYEIAKTQVGNSESTWAGVYQYWYYRAVSNEIMWHPNGGLCDWCALFVSWCMYQQGVRTGNDRYMIYAYSTCADPRTYIKGYIGNYDDTDGCFNLENGNIYFTNKSFNWYNINKARALNTTIKRLRLAYCRSSARNYDPLKIPYKRGGLIFFNWDGTGYSYDHIGIVESYNSSTKALTYISGNDRGQVRRRTMYLNRTECFGGFARYLCNKERIMAYAEY